MAHQQAMAHLPAPWRQLAAEQRRARQSTARIRRHRDAIGVDPVRSAQAAGLRYVNDARLPGIRRVGKNKRFRYVDPSGRTVSDLAVLQRIRSLVIPPAWSDVWICPHPLGHLQATGRDSRNRKQYRYHPKWREVRDEVKYGRLLAFAEALPRIRARTLQDLATAGLPREKVLATVVQLLEKTLIRIGNEEYARENHSVGLTTMRDQHAVVNGTSVRFEFTGKSGIAHSVHLQDARLARIVKQCRDLPGYELFQYVDEQGQRQAIDSADVNQYLQDVCGETFSAKDFRTWAGTVLAARALATLGSCATSTAAKRNILRAIDSVSKQLGNTKAVSRKCYIHPIVLEAYMDGEVIRVGRGRDSSGRRSSALQPEESAVVALIERRAAGGMPSRSGAQRTRR